MPLAFSYTVDQLWADKTAFDRTQWFNRHSEEIALKRGAAINALREFAAAVKATRAHERHTFDAEQYVNEMIDAMQATLAPEVREWLEG